MDLVADSTDILSDFEGSLVSPGVVPGVDGEPVVFSTFGSPADELDGMTSEGLSRLMAVDSALVGWEVLVDGEGGSNSSVLVDLLLDL